MKTIVENVSNISIHLFNDDDNIILQEDGVYQDGQLRDSEFNSINATIENIETFPEDWIGRKYRLISGVWQLVSTE